jgi:MFS family permease
VLALLVMIVVSNNSAGALAQPAIAAAFGAGPADVGWVVFGFSAAFAVATAVWGGLARRFGLGPSLAAGIVMVSVGSVIAVLAPSLPVLIAARIFQGLGAGAIPTLSAAVVAGRFAGPERARALGGVVAGVGVGLAVGPIVGGLALELVGWQGPVAFGIVAAPAALVLAREDRDRDRTGRFDVAGMALVATAVIAGTFSLNRLPLLGLSATTGASLAVLVLAVTLLMQRSTRPGVFLPRRIVTSAVFIRAAFLAAVGMCAFLGCLVLVPVAAASVHDLDGIALGLLLLPMALTAALAALGNGNVRARLGDRWTTITSLSALTLGPLGIAALGPGAAPHVLAIALIPLGLGFGLLGPPLLDQLASAVPAADRSLSVGLYNLVFFLGGTVGASLSSALVQAGMEMPIFAGRPLAGFSSAVLLLAVPPAIAIVVLARGSHRARAKARRTTA